jgi:hypothetical protein
MSSGDLSRTPAEEALALQLRTAGTQAPAQTGPSSLADILERVLDKGIVIAGDIQINLLEIELLTIRLRLLVASVDRAREMGINWWEGDSSLSSSTKELKDENQTLRERLERLEQMVVPAGAQRLERLEEQSGRSGRGSAAGGRTGKAEQDDENRMLRERLERLEQMVVPAGRERLDRLEEQTGVSSGSARGSGSRSRSDKES